MLCLYNSTVAVNDNNIGVAVIKVVAIGESVIYIQYLSLIHIFRYKIYGEEMLQQFRKVKMDYQKTIDIIRKYRDSQL